MMKPVLVSTLLAAAALAMAVPVTAAPPGAVTPPIVGAPAPVHGPGLPTIAPNPSGTPATGASAAPGKPGASPAPGGMTGGPVMAGGHERLEFGTIASITNKTTLVVRLRTGYPRRVDASEAIRTGHSSIPLYVGKPVAIIGILEPNGIFRATSVIRATNLTRLGSDRFVSIPLPTMKP